MPCPRVCDRFANAPDRAIEIQRSGGGSGDHAIEIGGRRGPDFASRGALADEEEAPHGSGDTHDLKASRQEPRVNPECVGQARGCDNQALVIA